MRRCVLRPAAAAEIRAAQGAGAAALRGHDERVNAGIPEFRAALDAVGVPYSLNMYPGTQHGFHNDSSAARYNERPRKLAWQRTIDFFETI
jgi:carboxymethylenebutenolidase